jgi:hypothetical protein
MARETVPALLLVSLLSSEVHEVDGTAHGIDVSVSIHRSTPCQRERVGSGSASIAVASRSTSTVTGTWSLRKRLELTQPS